MKILKDNRLVKLTYSKLNIQILNLLSREGYIRYYFRDGDRDILVYTKKFSVQLKPISKPSKRQYLSYKQITKLKFNCIISTPKGLFSNTEIGPLNVGGEILFRIVCQN